MAELVGPARCKADILHGSQRVIETFGPPRADSMMAREYFFPPQRPNLRLHPIGSLSTCFVLCYRVIRRDTKLWIESG